LISTVPECPIVSPQAEADAEELRLLARTAGGDRDAFRQLYGRYSRPLFSLAVRMVGNVGEAEELLQDAFVKMWRGAPAYDSRKSRPFTWAVTIVRRRCIDHLRRRTPTLSTCLVDEEAVAAVDASPPRAAMAAEESAAIRAALDAMPRNQREALDLAIFSQLSHSEIAERLGEPMGSVKSWIRRGLLDLRTTLKAHRP
jgi:RNA polymerase sigma-70 factor (ECF subfamily)